jgi:hypothetical protein
LEHAALSAPWRHWAKECLLPWVYWEHHMAHTRCARRKAKNSAGLRGGMCRVAHA